MKRLFSLILSLCLILSLGGSALAIGEFSGSAEPTKGYTVHMPEAYQNGNGVINGYYAATAPIVMQTGATGYSVKMNYLASTSDSTGFITVEPGNRDKYSRAVDAEENGYWTGDAPCCSADQKSTVRWLRYNSALGYIPGDIDRIVTWGSSGGGAHVAGTQWGNKKYMNMKHLEAMDAPADVAC